MAENTTLFQENGQQLKDAIKGIEKDFDLVYFSPSSSKVASIDTGKCMAVSEYDNVAQIAMKPLDGNLHTEETCKLNVGMIQSANKWQNFIGKKPPAKKIQGLNYKVVDGYFADNPRFFENAKVASSGIATSFNSITECTNGFIRSPNGNQHQYSVEWHGLFTPPNSGQWHFRTVSDDASYLWIGDNAVKNYSTGNALVKNGGLHGMQSRGGTLYLEKGKSYPIRIQFGENWVDHNMTIGCRGPTTLNRYMEYNIGTLVSTDFNVQDNTLYYSLVENTPELSAQGLYNCYIADTTNINNNQTAGKNQFNYKVIWRAFDEKAEINKLHPKNFAYYRNGALFVCNERGEVLKQIGVTIDQNKPGYFLNTQEANTYIYRYPDLMREANARGIYFGGFRKGLDGSISANIHWMSVGSKERRTFEVKNPANNLKLDNNGNILLRGKAVTTVNNTGSVDNPMWKTEISALNRKSFLHPHDPTGKATNEYQGDVLRRTTWNNQTLLISDNGKFKLEITELGNLVIKQSIKGCTDVTKSGMKYTTMNDNQRGSNYYLYETNADMKMDKLFVGQVNNDKRILKPVNENGSNLIKSKKYVQYANYVPPTTEGATTVSNSGECEQKCTNDPSCDYYASYTTEDGKQNCKTGANTGIKQFIPIQPNSGIKSSQLYIRTTDMNLPTNDIRNKIPRKNTSDYQSYSTYEVSPAVYEIGSSQIIQGNYTKTRDVQRQIVNGTENKKEPFNNHDYKTSEEVNAVYASEPTELGLAKAIQQNQIAPLNSIANDYNTLMQNIHTEYNKIGEDVKSVTNSDKTGLRDKLIADKKSGYLDSKYDMVPQVKDTVDQRLEDIDAMIAQTNTVYTLGTVTAFTLIVAGIFVMRK